MVSATFSAFQEIARARSTRNFRDKKSEIHYHSLGHSAGKEFAMSLEQFPPNIEQGIERFAVQHHLSHDVALIKLLETGLQYGQPIPTIRGLSGVPMSDDDAGVVDEALDLAMDARRQRSERRRTV